MEMEMRVSVMLLLLSLAGSAQGQGAEQEMAAARAEAAAAAAGAQREVAVGREEIARARAAADADRAGARSRRHAAPTEQEELAIAALEGLMAAPPERALPLLKRVLAGSQTDLVKMRALFVLSQINNDEAQKMLLDLARADTGDLRLESIRMIGIGGNAASLAALAGLYKGGDADVRREVLSAYLIAGRKTEVLQLAREADNEDDARAAIRALGAMNALAELRQLGDLGKYSGALVQAYAMAGDLASLRKLAETAPEADVRVDATRSIGMISGKESSQALRELYRSNQDPRVRRAALDGLMMSGDEAGLLEIYRTSTSTEEKKTVLRQLTMIGGDAALEAIDAALQGKAP
jgi:hypothetical protein